MTPTARRLLLAAACTTGALVAVPGPALAATPKKARLAATSVSTPPSPLTTGQRFVATGKVKNTGKGAGVAQLSFKLRTASYPYVSLSLGGGRTPSIARGRTRAFSVGLTVAQAPSAAQAGKGYLLVVCVTRFRGDTGVCRKSARAVTLRPDGSLTQAPAPAATPGAPPPPAATPPPVPAPLGTVPAPGPASGARSLGDTLFPTIGNGGYDALHYDLDLSYDIEFKKLAGTATVRMVATQGLSDFSLDLASYVTAQSVEVDGRQARFAQDYDSDKLVVIPETPVPDGATFTTRVTYRAVEQAYLDPDGSEEGWVPDTTRGAIVVSEPVGSMGWFPNNNVPFDKATYTIKMAVPELGPGEAPWRVIGTGVQVGEPVVADGKRTYTWDDTDPTASYLVSVAVGKFDVGTTLTTPTAGNPLSTPFTTAVDSSFNPAAKTNQLSATTGLNRTPAILDYYADYYRLAYPFTSKGGIIPRIPVGYSLETQSKPVYAGSTAAGYNGPGISTIAHENAHMYFGDSTTLTRWKDIWINEGMTEFTTRLWTERQNNPNSLPASTLSGYWTTNYNTPSPTFWNVAPADPPTAADIFDTDAMYTRGSMTMIGVKDLFGEEPFRRLMNDYLTVPKHVNGNSTSEEFIALVKAEDLANRTAAGLPDRTARWTEYFRQWLYTPYEGVPSPAGNKPLITAANFDTYTLP